MKTYSIKIPSILLSIILLWGCSSAPPKSDKEVGKKLELTLQMASLNLTNLNKRIERKNITDLVRILKREQVEVMAVQGISRYSGVSTRVDFVNELISQTDWRNAFGEMQNISGRQTGNAVFSSYPILSHHNQTFDEVKSASFDAALQATIDAGVRSLVVISAQLPVKATTAQQEQCIKLLAALNPDQTDPLTVITGNLPSLEGSGSAILFTEIQSQEPVKSNPPKIWFSTNTTLQLIKSRTIETDLGTLVIAQLGLFRQK